MDHGTGKIRAPSEADHEAIKDFFAVYDAHRAELHGTLMEAVMAIPALAEVMQRIDPAEAEAQQVEQRARERAAVFEGQWDPYLSSLHEQGVSYARMGLSFADWFRILRSYRVAMLEPLHARFGSDHAGLERAMVGMDAFIDLGMATIGVAYLAEKQEQIARAEGHSQAIYDGALDAIIVIDLQGRVVRYNPAAEALFGFVAADVVGKYLEQLIIPPEYREDHREGLRRYREGGEPRIIGERLELEALGPLGKRFPVEVVLTPIANTEPRLIAGFIRDLSELHRVADAYRRRAAELARSNRDLDNFAYVASHDLRAPLRNVSNLAEWVAEDLGGDLPAATKRHVEQLQQQVTRMDRLLNDLLEYSRAGRRRWASEHLELGTVLRDAVELAAVPETFSVEIRAEGITLHGPRAPLLQVVLNLISNAAKHHDRPDGRIAVTAQRQGDRVEVTVSDDGPGIDPTLHERAFEMFQQLHPPGVVEGTGMGLALVKKVVEAHDGELRLESTVGNGAAFSFTWPIDWNADPEPS